MANVKISQLPAASTVTADVDVLPIVHSGVTEKVTPNQIVNKVLEAPGEIGGTTPDDATFTTLTAESSVFLNPANADVELSPTGSGRTLIQPEAGAIINPGVLSYMDNVAIGGTTPQAAVFTTLTSNSTTTLNGTTIPASKTLVDTDSVQTLSSKYYLNPRIWDWDQNNYYRISPLSPGLATDVYCYLPILPGNDYFSFRNFTETLTNKTISGLSNTLTDIPNSSFQYSSITLGSTSISLGGTASSITGLALTGGTVNNTAIGGTTASSGAFTTLSASSTVSGTGFSTYLASPPAIGGTTAASGAFTTLSASSTVSGTGFSTYLASPPAIGGTTPAAGAFTTLSSTGNTTLGDASGDTLTINGTAVSIPNNLNFDSNTLFIDATNNRIGVGNTSPSTLIEASGDITIRKDGGALYFRNNGATAYPAYISATDASAFTLSANQNIPIVLKVNDTERARITSKGLLVDYTSDSGLSGPGNAIFSGSVGIGTSSPGEKLQVYGVGANIKLSGNYAANQTNAIEINDGQTGVARYATGLKLTSDSGGGYSSSFYVAAGSDTDYTCLTAAPSYTALYTSNTERLRIDSSGNLGLGVAPSGWYGGGSGWKALQVGAFGLLSNTATNDSRLMSNAYLNTGGSYIYLNSSQNATNYIQSAGVHSWYTASSGTAGSAISFTQAMTLDASGRLFVGCTGIGVWGTRLHQSTDAGTTKWCTGPYETATNYIISASGTGGVYLSGTSATSWTAVSSDERLKNKVADIRNAILSVNKLNPLKFFYKNEPNEGVPRYGFFAQNVGEAIPDAMLMSPVKDKEFGDIYTYDASIINVYLVRAVQELHAEIELLKAKVN